MRKTLSTENTEPSVWMEAKRWVDSYRSTNVDLTFLVESSQAHEHYADSVINNFTVLCISSRTDFPAILAVSWKCLFLLLTDEWNKVKSRIFHQGAI